MSQRRMFSPSIVCSDAFLDMPSSGRDLYFQLGMYADDDGFVNPRKIMRMLGSSEDDLKILIAKRFVLPFPSGVLVIKHWKINNLVRKDWYRPTQYIEEKSKLSIKENGSYTEDVSQWQPLVNDSSTQVRLGKVNKEDEKVAKAPFPSSSEVSQENQTITFDDWLITNGYTTTEYYAGEEEGMVMGWKHRSRKSPFNESELRKRYLGHVKGQSPRGEAYKRLQEVSSVWSHFEKLCEKELGKKPIQDAKSRAIITFALGKVGSKEIYEVIDEWFSLGKPDEETIQITRALSGSQLNSYRARN